MYPVPDGDTGTNMALTLAAVAEELDAAGDDLAAVCKAISHGSLMGARGNSGVILSQILRGIAGVVAEADGARRRPAPPGRCPRRPTAAYEAVMRPVEGTILTVVREASEAATAAADDGADLVAVLEAAQAQGADALARTPDLLPVLKDAGVVDAGGTGLPAAARRPAARGRRSARAARPPRSTAPSSPSPLPGHGDHGEHGDVSELRYEVMYFLEAPDDAIPAFKDVWAGIGDSIVVVGGDGIWNCHIHTDDIGASIEAAIDIGTPAEDPRDRPIEQVEEERWVRDAAEAGAIDEVPEHLRTPVTCAVVAVATGDGIRRIFHSLGVQGIVTGGQSMNPSTAELHRGRGGGAGRPRRHPAQQQEHHPGGPAGGRAHDQDRGRRADEGDHRGLRRPAGLRPRGRGDRERGGDDRGGGERRRRRGHPGGAGLQLRRRPHRHRRLAGHRARRHPGRGDRAGRRRHRAARTCSSPIATRS